MYRSIQIMGGSFRRGLDSDFVTFSTRLADSEKSNQEKQEGSLHNLYEGSSVIGCLRLTPLFSPALCCDTNG